MARKGEIAREKVKQIIINAFGDNFVAEQDKKLYVWADDGGEKVQFSIALTMPKTIIGEAPRNTNDWTDMPVMETSVPTAKPTVSISEEDSAKIAELMKTLELI